MTLRVLCGCVMAPVCGNALLCVFAQGKRREAPEKERGSMTRSQAWARDCTKRSKEAKEVTKRGRLLGFCFLFMVCLGLEFTIRTTLTLGVTCGVQKVVCSYPWAGVAHSRMWFRKSVRLWNGIYLS